MLSDQVADYAQTADPVRHRRAVEAPRFKVCRCRLLAPTVEVAFSPASELLTSRCTPELERVQAALGARTSFREAARLPKLCCLPPRLMPLSIRNSYSSESTRRP